MSSITLPAGLPSTIKTVLQPSKLSSKIVLTKTPLPVPSDEDDVLIKVHATSPTAGELWWARDYPEAIPEDKLPVPCSDLSGVVVASPAHSKFRPGDEVYARVNASRSGNAREYSLARISELALKPKSLNFIETAATPLSALTAYQALFVQGSLDATALQGDSAARERNSGIRVLVTAASGGVGSWVVQLARLAGAGAIVAVAGKGKESLVRGLGATDYVDYTKQSLADWALEDPSSRECDLVVDCIAGPTLALAWSAVKSGGVLVSIAGLPDAAKPTEGPVAKKELSKSVFFIVEPLGSQLEEIAKLIDDGKVKPVVDSVWELEEFEKAFARLEEGHAKGKIIIKIDGQT